MVKNKIKRLIQLIKIKLGKDPDKFLKKVSGLVHVGANSGQERSLYSKYGLNVIWIEPIPEVFTQLKNNLQGFNNQLAFQALITDIDDKEYEFHISNNSGASSSIFDFKKHKDVWPMVHYTSTLNIRSKTLPTLIREEKINIDNYQALILDTQGSELHVLRGSLPILNNFRFIKVEVPDFESYEGCCQLSEINSFMAEHGFNQFSINKFANKAMVGSYYDIVFKKRI